MGQTETTLGVSPLEKELLSYWDDNPRASDTAKKILDWWLEYKRYERNLPRIERALQKLVDKKLILKNSRPALQEPTFRLNAKMQSKVSRLVKGSAD